MTGDNVPSRLMRELGWKNQSPNEHARKFAAAYIDPCHQGHIEACSGVPIAGSQWHGKYGKTFNVNYTIPAGHEVVFYLTPYAECPLVAWDNTSRSLRGFQDPAIDEDYWKSIKAYAFRPFGLGVTIYNPNPELTKQGTLIATRIAPCIDKHSVPLANNRVTYSRVFEGAPYSYDTVSAYSVKNQLDAKDGVYLPNRVIDSTFPYTYRNTEWEKASYTAYKEEQGVVVVDTTIRNTLAFSLPTADGTSNEIIYVSKNTSPAMVNSNNSIAVTGTNGNGMMLGVIAFSAPTADQTYSIKVAHGYEYLIKATSVTGGFYLDPLIPDPWLIDAVFLFLARNKDLAYPARYNFWAKLWEGFKSIYRKLRPALPAVIKYLPGPGPAIAEAATNVLDSIVK